MNLIFKSSFERDIKKVTDKDLIILIENAMRNTEEAGKLQEISNIKKLSGYKTYYRIKIKDHRIGLCIENDTVYFVFFRHRKDIYKVFP
jgi:mRNA interferase RelE/StbE